MRKFQIYLSCLPCHQGWYKRQRSKVSFYTNPLRSDLNCLLYSGPSQAEQLLRVTSGIAAELIKAYDAKETVSLNEIRAKVSKKHGYGGVPRLVDIISAIPEDYKKALLPRLRARPIRTASGVCNSLMALLSKKLISLP